MCGFSEMKSVKKSCYNYNYSGYCDDVELMILKNYKKDDRR